MKTSLLADIGFTVLGIICAIFAFVAYYNVSTDAFVVLIILAAVLFIIGSVYGRLIRKIIRNNIFERGKMNKKIITIILTLSTMFLQSDVRLQIMNQMGVIKIIPIVI